MTTQIRIRSPFILQVVLAAVFGGCPCGCADDGDTMDGSEDTSSTEKPGDAGNMDSDTSSETVDAIGNEADLLEESAAAVTAAVAVTRYIDEAVPAQTATAALSSFLPEWNITESNFCSRLGNGGACPSVTCDLEAREAVLLYESTFDGCDLTGCYVGNQPVAGEVRIKRSENGNGTAVKFDAFTLGKLFLEGTVEVSATGDVKTVEFSGDDDAECAGVAISRADGYASCISGSVAIAEGDDEATGSVTEQRTVEMTDLAFNGAHRAIVLNGTLIWVQGVECLGPQTGSLQVSVESKAKDTEENPLLAVSFDLTFSPDNRDSVQSVIQGSELFADYETLLPRGLFCSLPKVEGVAFAHGDIADFKEAEFAAAFVVAVVESVTKKAEESPKATALRALVHGLSAEDILARLQEAGDGKLLRFIQAPVKGLCLLDDTATCPAITVTCGPPSDAQSVSSFFECAGMDIGYEEGAADDPVPEILTLDFGGPDGSCTTRDGAKYGGTVIVERSLDDPSVLAFTFESFAIYREAGDTEVSDTLRGKIFGEVERASETCVTDNELLGTVTFATPVFNDGGDMGLTFQKGECPETQVVLNPLAVTLSDETETPAGRDRATESFYMTWTQDKTTYYLSSLEADVPGSCDDDGNWPDWADDNTAGGVYYDLPMSCTCPLSGPVTLGTEAYVISVDNADCIALCTGLGSLTTGLDTACQQLCDIVVAEGAAPLELASAALSLSLGFQSTCGEIAICESAVLREVPDSICLERNGNESANPCASMVGKGTSARRAKQLEEYIAHRRGYYKVACVRARQSRCRHMHPGDVHYSGLSRGVPKSPGECKRGRANHHR